MRRSQTCMLSSGWTLVCVRVQITFFAAIMCMDKRRQEKRRMDLLTCVTSTAPERAGYCCGLLGKPAYSEGYRTRMMTWVGTQYTKKPVKAVVILMWLGLLSAGLALREVLSRFHHAITE